MSLATPILNLPKKTLDWLASLPNSDVNSWLEREFPDPLHRLAILDEICDPLAVKRCQASLSEFMRRAWSEVEAVDFTPGWHLDAMSMHLEAVEKRQIQNLLINIPPGCCKSLLCAVFFPAWVWTFAPETRFFYASYAQEFSIRDSVKCRTLITSPWYRERWPNVKLTSDGSKKFENSNGGWRIATSVGGRGTGEHPDVIVIDDPHKARDSSDVMLSACDWLDGTISTRGRSRGARKIIVMQRLHENDMSAHVMSRGGWDSLCLPMEAEPDRAKPTSLGWIDNRPAGELLWPRLFTKPRVEQMVKDLGEARSAGQLQQRPAPAGGLLFKREWFKVDANVPQDGVAVRYWDKAATPGSGDYSVGVLMSAKDGKFYVHDVVRGQWGATERNTVIRNTAASDMAAWPNYTVWLEEEPGSGGKESAEFSVKDLAGFRVKTERVTGDKVTRAYPLEAQLGAGNVVLKAGEWNQAYVDEMTVFPQGKNDDQVDATSGAINKLFKKKSLMIA